MRLGLFNFAADDVEIRDLGNPGIGCGQTIVVVDESERIVWNGYRPCEGSVPPLPVSRIALPPGSRHTATRRIPLVYGVTVPDRLGEPLDPGFYAFRYESGVGGPHFRDGGESVAGLGHRADVPFRVVD